MEGRFCLGLAVIILLGNTAAALGQSVPDSGIGQQGRLTGNDGSHASTVKGPVAAAKIPVNPKPANASHNDPKLEKDPSQGGTQQH
jgi:hypothetical protein